MTSNFTPLLGRYLVRSRREHHVPEVTPRGNSPLATAATPIERSFVDLDLPWERGGEDEAACAWYLRTDEGDVNVHLRLDADQLDFIALVGAPDAALLRASPRAVGGAYFTTVDDADGGRVLAAVAGIVASAATPTDVGTALLGVLDLSHIARRPTRPRSSPTERASTGPQPDSGMSSPGAAPDRVPEAPTTDSNKPRHGQPPRRPNRSWVVE